MQMMTEIYKLSIKALKNRNSRIWNADNGHDAPEGHDSVAPYD
jgi:hypothetical protein